MPTRLKYRITPLAVLVRRAVGVLLPSAANAREWDRTVAVSTSTDRKWATANASSTETLALTADLRAHRH